MTGFVVIYTPDHDVESGKEGSRTGVHDKAIQGGYAQISVEGEFLDLQISPTRMLNLSPKSAKLKENRLWTRKSILPKMPKLSQMRMRNDRQIFFVTNGRRSDFCKPFKLEKMSSRCTNFAKISELSKIPECLQ